jgi:hypothetical protein
MYATVLEDNNNGTGVDLGAEDPGLPRIELVGPSDVRLPYSEPLPFSLLACESVDQTQACGATAFDPRSGVDLSSAIR